MQNDFCNTIGAKRKYAKAKCQIADTLPCEREDMNFGFFVQQLAEFFAMHLARRA
jgi:hypothetical protein